VTSVFGGQKNKCKSSVLMKSLKLFWTIKLREGDKKILIW